MEIKLTKKIKEKSYNKISVVQIYQKEQNRFGI